MCNFSCESKHGTDYRNLKCLSHPIQNKNMTLSNPQNRKTWITVFEYESSKSKSSLLRSQPAIPKHQKL